MKYSTPFALAGLTAFLGGVASAADLVIDTNASSTDVTTTIVADMPSSLIGDYDEKTNPGGTRTLPGLFGGSGNQAIDLGISTSVDSALDAPPGGTFGFNPDFEALTLSIDNLFLDVLGEVPGSLAIGLQLSFETFRSFNPDSLFPGGTYPFDAGGGEITIFTASQSGPTADGVLIPDPEDENHFQFLITVPVTINIEAVVIDQSINPGPIEALLPIAGDIVIDGTTITVTQTVETDLDETIVDPPNSDYADIPFDIPTILPPGDVAHVLLSGTVASINMMADLNFNIVATGELDSNIPGDVNGDGVVDVEDLLQMLGAWGACPECPEDIDGNGVVDVDDLLILLANWS